jgi:signal transduction histidine kinase
LLRGSKRRRAIGGVVVQLAASIQGPLARAARVLGVALGYYALAWIGTVLSVPPFGFAIIWPATAFLTGALLLTPVRWWWAYLIGLVPAHLLLVQHIPHGPVPLIVAVPQIAGNVSLAAATALAMRRTHPDVLTFDTLRRALVFIVVAGIAVPAVVNALILSVHLATGWAADFWLSWRQWMLASIFPSVTIVPLMVVAARKVVVTEETYRARTEALLLCALLFALTWLVFGRGVQSGFRPTVLLIPLPILLWAAMRWGVGGASLALLVFAGAIIARALEGAGPFAAGASAVDALSLQVYLTAISIPLILVAALVQERRRAQDQLQRSEARMALAAASTDTGLWQWDAAAGQLWMTEHCRSMFALGPDAATPDAFLGAVHPDDRPSVRAALDDALASRDISLFTQFRVLKGGEERWYVMRATAEQGPDGEPVRLSGVFRDVTQRQAAQLQSEQLAQRLLTLQEDERRAIAEALHASTAQHLVAGGLMLDMLERRMAQTDETRGLLADIRTMIAEATTELRTFTYLLRPPELEQQGLCEVLQKYVRGFGLRTGLHAWVRLSPHANDLPIEHQRAFLRITQESLANIHRHAAAKRISVGLRRHARELHLVVRDDGRGIPASGRADGEPVRMGVGIPGMAARIRQLGGKLDVRTGPKGTTVHAVLPIDAAQHGRRARAS